MGHFTKNITTFVSGIRIILTLLEPKSLTTWFFLRFYLLGPNQLPLTEVQTEKRYKQLYSGHLK